MSIEGIWTLEFYGAFGWESAGVLILEKGRALGGGNNHYSRGTYALENDTVLITVESIISAPHARCSANAKPSLRLRSKGRGKRP
jgi:hypothetical protein